MGQIIQPDPKDIGPNPTQTTAIDANNVSVSKRYTMTKALSTPATMSKQRSTLLPTTSNVASTLLLVWTGLKETVQYQSYY